MTETKLKKVMIAAAAILVSSAASAETYRLVHAIGTTENVSAKGLDKEECEIRKKELKIVATALGTYNEATGYGSITCLPDSLFDD